MDLIGDGCPSCAKVDIELDNESEFKDVFPACEAGAMPPFGNHYEMEVLIDENFTKDEKICFNAGSHAKLARLAF